MIEVISIFNDFKERVKPEQNGELTISSFNSKSRLAEILLLDYLSGDVEGVKPPEPWATQKLKDWLSHFLTPYSKQVNDGKISKPDDYYGYETQYMIGSYLDKDGCDEDKLITGKNTPIELVDSGAFDTRNNSFIKGVAPDVKHPISKLEGDVFIYSPSDIGSVVLVYRRYPKFAQIIAKRDDVYMNEIPDPDNKTDYEWPEFARPLLLYFMTTEYAGGTREEALQKQNEVIGKGERK